MKIVFNKPFNYHQPYLYKENKQNTSPATKQSNLNGLDCFSNYNLTFGTRKPRVVYMIDYDGTYERIKNISKIEGTNKSAIGSVLCGKCTSLNNKTYIYADDVELPNGDVDINEIFKAILRFKETQNQPIYSIDYFGNVQRFENRKNASAQLHISLGDINKALNQKRNPVSGYAFVRAFDIELRDKNGKLLKSENNEPILDIYTISKLREGFLYAGKRFPVVSIDKKGNVVQYQNIKDASIKTDTKRINIDQSLLNQSITQGEYTYARLSDVVLIDEFGDVVFDKNNNFAIDFNKVNAIRKAVFKNNI